MENLNQQLAQLFSNPQFLFPFVIWSLFWKGFALWQTAARRHLVWFLIIFLINTLGLLEIAYIFYLHKWDIDNGKLLAFLEKKLKKEK